MTIDLLSQEKINTIADSKCSECGEKFSYTPLNLYGKEVFRPTVCPSCDKIAEEKRDAEERERAAEREKEIARQREKLWIRITPKLYQLTEVARLPQEQLAQVMSWEYGPRGLILVGRTGTGKTRCAYQLLRRLIREGVEVIAMDSTDLCNQCSDAFATGRGYEWTERLIWIPLLMIDDLGNEPAGERASGELFHVIKRRGEELLPIIITTNSVGDELAIRLKGPADRGAAMVRRLRESCDAILFPGPSNRKPINPQGGK